MTELKDIKDPIEARQFLATDFHRYLIGLAGYEYDSCDLVFHLEENEDFDAEDEYSEYYLITEDDLDEQDFLYTSIYRYCLSRDLPTEWLDVTILEDDWLFEGETEWGDIYDAFFYNVIMTYRTDEIPTITEDNEC